MVIKLKNRRTRKLHELRDRYQNASSNTVKERIVEKIRRVAPHLSPTGYLGAQQAARSEAKAAPAAKPTPAPVAKSAPAPRRSTAKKEKEKEKAAE